MTPASDDGDTSRGRDSTTRRLLTPGDDIDADAFQIGARDDTMPPAFRFSAGRRR